MERRTYAVLAAVLLVALFDIVTGLRLLVSPAPHLVNGQDTLWAREAPALALTGERAPVLLASLYQRLGAFSLHVGIVTAVWAILARANRRLLTTLLVTYLVTGAAFFFNDVTYFQGTAYFRVKQVLGTLWLGALILHLAPRRAPAARSSLAGPRAA